ncbi:hypothetical protein FKG94_17920 [Exilibacterium tricleocarpae]|uniref:Baseplate J-like C-terminal domain-containing protein n=1 Tax=Exilibacterium tricleocarpae TaxID=2591008 RepID=A0A545T5R2_9GAMM|nr:baseplate J/gp47 family protein [Exilibacterium tricleocarpae]TQV72580.1 hypothetical protein FKG94_17920 [Exilibacterium tricleocarpae]
MSVFPVIDLAGLRSPVLADAPDREAIVAELKRQLCHADVEEVMIDRIMHVFASRELALRERVDEALKAVMLASAGGSDLDHTVALYGVKRLIVKPADPEASPPVDAILESDERLRLRARLSLAALSQAGCQGAYLFQALSASPHIRDVSIQVPNVTQTRADRQREVQITILLDPDAPLADEPDKSSQDPHQEIITKVEEALSEVCSITDRIAVKLANPYPYDVRASVTPASGADERQIKQAVTAALARLVVQNHRLGKPILRSEFFAALYQPGVERATLGAPKADRAIPMDTVAVLSTASGRDNPVIEIKAGNAHGQSGT